MTISIRKAKLDDIGHVHQLVRELAIYEKAEDQLHTTAELYSQDYKDGLFECIVAFNDQNQILGTCIFYQTYSTWKGKMMWLEDFVVTEKARGQGIGAKLFEWVINESKNRKSALLKWQIINWNDPALNFYQKYAYIKEDNWLNGKIFFEY